MLSIVLVFILLSVHFAWGEIVEEDVLRAIAELGVANLTMNLLDWETDLAIMFYAPWCSYCKQLEPSWGTIASLKEDNRDIVVGKFNCEESLEHTDLCKELNVNRYPSVYFIGYGNFNQGSGGNIFGKGSNPRVVQYTADLYPTAIFDWVNTMTALSALHRRWDDFKGLFTGKSRQARQLGLLRSRVVSAEKKASSSARELERYKANELFDELDNLGDPFVLLSTLPPDKVVCYTSYPTNASLSLCLIITSMPHL